LAASHEVTNVGLDRAQLASTATAAKEVLSVDTLEAVADRGYFNGEEIKACDEAGITVTLPKPMTSGAKSAGRFGKQDFVYLAEENAYRCPAGEKLTYRYTNEENGQRLHRTGRMPVARARSKRNAWKGTSGASRAGSTKLS
jgi:transposase